MNVERGQAREGEEEERARGTTSALAAFPRGSLRPSRCTAVQLGRAQRGAHAPQGEGGLHRRRRRGGGALTPISGAAASAGEPRSSQRGARCSLCESVSHILASCRGGELKGGRRALRAPPLSARAGQRDECVTPRHLQVPRSLSLHTHPVSYTHLTLPTIYSV